MAQQKNEKNKKSSYGAADITVLEGLEPVRKRPGMYIGTTGPDGLHHLITEVFDNSRDEAMGGFANNVEIVLLPDNRVRVADNGRGIPVDTHKQTKVSALETIMTTLHAGGKFGGEGYKVSGGLHGVGVSVVNALSIYVKAEVHRDGGKFVQEYSKGKRKQAVKKVASSKLHGTVITFEPDPEIFSAKSGSASGGKEDQIKFDFHRIASHMRQQAYLVKGLKISVMDARECPDKIDADKTFYFRELGFEVPSVNFYFEGGLVSFIKFQNQREKPIHKSIFYVEKEVDQIGVEVALQYVDDISAKIFPFANNIYNGEGGTHLTGFKTSLTRTLNNYARKNNLIKEKEENFTGEDVLEGLSAVISVKLREVQFEGQTKAKLGSVEARGAVETIFGDTLAAFFEENPDEARAIVGKVTLALKARKAAKAAKDSVLRKGALDGMTLPGKLADCSSKSAEESELFIVEGDSAGGSAKQGRDRNIQAVLPLKGKILNVERYRLDRVLAFQEIKSLVIALGTAIGDTFNLENLRYHKIIIATDADVDGAHIRTLLLTLFYRHFRPIIEGGYLYIAQPPLYKIKKGKEILYFYTEEDKNKYLKNQNIQTQEVSEAGGEDENEGGEEAAEEEKEEKKGAGSDASVGVNKKAPRLSIQRYKGLGEMNPEELWETTMDPSVRRLKQVEIKDAQDADKVFDVLMGANVVSRKSFIQSNAKYANLDV